MITFQHVFNLAWQKFIVEDAPPAIAANGVTCRYRTEDGRKCAIGLALPEGHPASSTGQEGGVASLIREYPDLQFEGVCKGSFVEVDRWSELQRALHDRLVRRDKWAQSRDERERHYRDVAKLFNLTVPSDAHPSN